MSRAFWRKLTLAVIDGLLLGSVVLWCAQAVESRTEMAKARADRADQVVRLRVEIVGQLLERFGEIEGLADEALMHINNFPEQAFASKASFDAAVTPELQIVLSNLRKQASDFNSMLTQQRLLLGEAIYRDIREQYMRHFRMTQCVMERDHKGFCELTDALESNRQELRELKETIRHQNM